MVPQELRDRAQWLTWRFEQKPGQEKPAKMPYYADGARRQGKQGSDEDRRRLVSYDRALAAAPKNGGIGFAFLPDDGLIGIDLDGMIDADTGEISERGREIIKACNSFTEYSPSGKGVHIYALGDTATVFGEPSAMRSASRFSAGRSSSPSPASTTLALRRSCARSRIKSFAAL
jgi:primase-polymerase (primpol)-like protein